ncbi:hypothetical protein V1281_001501 [Nitrobacteraceae bacterium AZCC 2161]
MAVAGERFVHFLLDLDGSPPQRCRVSFAALALLEEMVPLSAHRDQSMRIFRKHRRMIEGIARTKVSTLKAPTKWISILAGDLTP